MNKGAVLYSPLWKQSLTNLRMRKGRALITDIGRELYCPRCKEFWPADTEFFHSTPSHRDGLAFWCKACYSVADKLRRDKNKQKLKEIA